MGAVEVQCLATSMALVPVGSSHLDPVRSDLDIFSCEFLSFYLHLNGAPQSIRNPFLRLLLFPACAVCLGILYSSELALYPAFVSLYDQSLREWCHPTLPSSTSGMGAWAAFSMGCV
jgi:hypothetical protein